MTLFIRNAALVTMDGRPQVIPKASIRIDDSHITEVSSAQRAPRGAEVIEGEGMVALPGLVNAHTHAAMTLLRGVADDMPLLPWLKRRIWPVEMKLTGDDVYWGAMLASAEMLRGGVTTFNDMYHFFEATAQAVADSGIRANLSGVLLGFLPDAPERLEKAIEFGRQWHRGADGRVVTMLGPHAPYTCPVPLLERVVAGACSLGIGLHVHLSETAQEVAESKQKHGLTPIELMDRLGMFNCRPVLAAHCVHLSDNDIAILKRRRVGVSHNPGSNMKLASGISPVPRLLREKVTVGLGTDGAASNNNLDLLEEARLAALLHKAHTNDPTVVTASQALWMATRGGAQALGLGNEIGKIAPGMRADIILVDLRQPHLWPPHSLISHLVYAARAGDVHTVIVNGKVVVRARELTALDLPKVMRETKARAERLI